LFAICELGTYVTADELEQFGYNSRTCNSRMISDRCDIGVYVIHATFLKLLTMERFPVAEIACKCHSRSQGHRK